MLLANKEKIAILPSQREIITNIGKDEKKRFSQDTKYLTL